MSKFVGGKKGSSVDLGKNTPAGVYSLADQYQGTRLGGWDGGIVATGGIISDYQEPTGELYRAHIFLAPGTFTVTSTGKSGDTTYDSTVDLMVVGSGGGGAAALPGYWAGAGGGAGGIVEVEKYPISTSPGSYTITIGNGGAGAKRNNPTTTYAPSADDTVFTNPSGPLTITAKGGGGGGGSGAAVPNAEQRGREGGSSGGSGACPGSGFIAPANASSTQPHYPTQQNQNPSYPSPQNLRQYGHFGGWGDETSTGEGSGGGGAGGRGEDVDNPKSATAAKVGGPGIKNSWAVGSSKTYGKGGNSGPPTGGSTQLGAIMNGDQGTGNGGNGGSNPNNAQPGGFGLRGSIIVRYRIGQSRTGAHLTAKATGGAIQYIGDQTVHVFYTPDNFVNASGGALNCNFLMVGGGGGGGCDNGGGGGGGEVVVGTNYPVPAATHAVVVGRGGRGAKAYSSPAPNDQGYIGEATTFNSLTARAGSRGGGAGTVARTGQSDMGNGGGGAGVEDTGGANVGGSAPAPASPTPTVVYHGGFDGGDGTSAPAYNAGGGAGAAAAGIDGDGPSPTMTNGGAGYQEPAPTAILGTPYYWGGGGGGGSWWDPPTGVAVMNGGAGGAGAGVGNGPGSPGTTSGTAGAGGLFTASPASDPTGGGWGANGTGGGGGGDGRSHIQGGSGGSGIFIISYPT